MMSPADMPAGNSTSSTARGTNLWLGSYANDHCAYLPSVRILLEGGYEADSSTVLFLLPSRFGPRVEDILVTRIRQMCKRLVPDANQNQR